MAFVNIYFWHNMAYDDHVILTVSMTWTMLSDPTWFRIHVIQNSKKKKHIKFICLTWFTNTMSSELLA
jgi:hypothetical protein